jgi:hypothetical protein
VYRAKRAAVRRAVFARIEESASDPALFYQLHRLILERQRSVPDFVTTPDGVLVSDPSAVMERWCSGFASLYDPPAFTSPLTAQLAARIEECLGTDGLEVPVLQAHPSASSTGALLNARISEQEVSKACDCARRRVAPGPDGVPMWVFKDGGPAVLRTTTLLFNDVLEAGVWPRAWSTGLIHPIFKAGDRSDPMQYRGISLLAAQSQLFRSVLNRRVSAYLESNGLLSQFQAGFRPRHGTLDHLLTLNEVATDCWEQGKPLYMAFLDVAKAYDRVWRDALWYRLKRVGVSGKLLRVFRASYSSVRRAVIVNDRVTPEFECRSGVAQGAVDSPTLYDVFIDELAQMLVDRGFGVSTAAGTLSIPLLMYADDVVLLSNSPMQLQRMLDAVSEYAEQWHFTYNVSKSAVVVAGSAMSGPKREAAGGGHSWTLSGRPLPVSEHYTYLGLEFGLLGPGRWVPAVHRLLRLARNSSREVLWANGNRLGLRPKLQVRLWSALCRPRLEYGSVLWGPAISGDLSDDLERVQTRFAKAMLGLPVCASDVFARTEAGMRPLSSRRDELALRLFGELLIDPKPGSPQRLVCQMVRQRLIQAREACRSASASSPCAPRPPSGHRFLPGAKSWCMSMRAVCVRYGLLDCWERGVGACTVQEWRVRCHQAVAAVEADRLRSDLKSHSTLTLYSQLKHTPGMAQYLDSSSNAEGRRLHCQLRAGVLPLCDRLSSVARLPSDHISRQCFMCLSGGLPPVPVPLSFLRPSASRLSLFTGAPASVESPVHFFFECPALLNLRTELLVRLGLSPGGGDSASGALPPLLQRWFAGASDRDRFLFLVGGDMSEYAQRATGAPPSCYAARLHRALSHHSTSATVTRHVHNFLMLAWRLRSKLCGGEPSLDQFCALRALAPAPAPASSHRRCPPARNSNADNSACGLVVTGGVHVERVSLPASLHRVGPV